MSNVNENEKTGNLFERFTSDRLRTVTNFRTMPAGARDIELEIELRDESCAALSFPAPWDGKFYCYYRTDKYDNEEKWFINDWGGGRCLMTKEINREQSYSEYVRTEDVLRLLEECLRIPAQRAIKFRSN